MLSNHKKVVKAALISLGSVVAAVGLFFGGYYFYNYKILLASTVLMGHELPDGSCEKITDKDYEVASYILDKTDIRYTLGREGTEILVSESDAKDVYLMFDMCSYDWEGSLVGHGDVLITKYDPSFLYEIH